MFEQKVFSNVDKFALKDKFKDVLFEVSDIVAMQQRTETLNFFAYCGDGKSSRIFTNIHLRDGVTVCSHYLCLI